METTLLELCAQHLARREAELRLDLRGRHEDTCGELRDVLAARSRLHLGTYGECVDCGAPIDPDRLLAQPAAARCAACEERSRRG